MFGVMLLVQSDRLDVGIELGVCVGRSHARRVGLELSTVRGEQESDRGPGGPDVPRPEQCRPCPRRPGVPRTGGRTGHRPRATWSRIPQCSSKSSEMTRAPGRSGMLTASNLTALLLMPPTSCPKLASGTSRPLRSTQIVVDLARPAGGLPGASSADPMAPAAPEVAPERGVIVEARAGSDARDIGSSSCPVITLSTWAPSGASPWIKCRSG